jgi:microcystin-dependent protein
MWSGTITAIPTGWALCNGQNGTPNLQDKFIVGAGSGYVVGATGGSADATLASHGHTASSIVTDPGHTHIVSRSDYPTPSNGGWSLRSAGDNGTMSSSKNTTGITVSTTITPSGVSATGKNLPPYYALAFIMKVP